MGFSGITILLMHLDTRPPHFQTIVTGPIFSLDPVFSPNARAICSYAWVVSRWVLIALKDQVWAKISVAFKE